MLDHLLQNFLEQLLEGENTEAAGLAHQIAEALEQGDSIDTEELVQILSNAAVDYYD